MLIDTHAHIYTTDFSEDRDVVIQEALAAEVGKILMPNIDVASLPEVLKVTGQYPGICFPMIGLHPGSVNAGYKVQLDELAENIGNHPFIGIGEIGIDLYWNQSFVEQQKDAFREQLRQARFKKLPVVIHVRESFREVFEILQEEQDGSLAGIFHCFSGSEKEASLITDLGFLMGIGGVVTYKNSRLPDVLRHTGPDSLVLETDAPWLTPAPMRGRRNECSFLRHTALKVAEIYDVPVALIAEITTRNARELFRI